MRPWSSTATNRNSHPTWRALAAVAGDAMANVFEAPQLLDVDVKQFARRSPLVTLDRLGRLQITQLGQTSATQHAADRRLGHAHVRRNTRLKEQLAPQL